MKENDENYIHLGNNIKHLMRAFQITQTQLAERLNMPDSHVCTLLQRKDIEEEMLQKIADAIGYGVTVEMIRNYNHEDTIKYIINNYTQNVENGGTGTYIPKQDNSTTFQEGSTQTNNYVAEQAFVLAEKNTKLEKLLLYYRMKLEPDIIEKEMEDLKKDCQPESVNK